MTELVTNIQTNTAKPQNFHVHIDDQPELDYHSDAVTIPSVNSNSTTRFFRGEPYHEQGDTLEFAPLSFRFKLDEDWKNYNHILNWISTGIKDDQRVDLTVTVFNNRNKAVQRYRFTDAFPISISEVDMDVKDEAGNIVLTAIFKYTKFYPEL